MPASDRTYPSAWARPRRSQRSTLTREQIVTGALRLLDSEGIGALSMRKLAAELGAGATSLYWHVANRDELIELILDEIYAEIDLPDPDEEQDWRAATRRSAWSIRSTILRHRWVVSELDHLVAATYIGPNQTRMAERMLALLETAGFPLSEAERALSTISAYVTGVAIGEAAFRNWLDRHGQTAQDWSVSAMQHAEQASQDSPRLREVLTSYEGKDPYKAQEEDFEYGLERVLDGLQARLDST